jgi:hypothetical protein
LTYQTFVVLQEYLQINIQIDRVVGVEVPNCRQNNSLVLDLLTIEIPASFNIIGLPIKVINELLIQSLDIGFVLVVNKVVSLRLELS